MAVREPKPGPPPFLMHKDLQLEGPPAPAFPSLPPRFGVSRPVRFAHSPGVASLRPPALTPLRSSVTGWSAGGGRGEGI